MVCPRGSSDQGTQVLRAEVEGRDDCPGGKREDVGVHHRRRPCALDHFRPPLQGFPLVLCDAHMDDWCVQALALFWCVLVFWRVGASFSAFIQASFQLYVSSFWRVLGFSRVAVFEASVKLIFSVT